MFLKVFGQDIVLFIFLFEFEYMFISLR